MNYFVLLLTVLQICSSYSELHKESSDEKSGTSTEINGENPLKISVLNSIIYGLTNILPVNGDELNQCEQELSIIKEGIRKKDIWALKREYARTICTEISMQISNSMDKKIISYLFF